MKEINKSDRYYYAIRNSLINAVMKYSLSLAELANKTVVTIVGFDDNGRVVSNIDGTGKQERELAETFGYLTGAINLLCEGGYLNESTVMNNAIIGKASMDESIEELKANYDSILQKLKEGQ